MIFAELNVEGLVKAAFCCKRWFDIIEDPANEGLFWKEWLKKATQEPTGRYGQHNSSF